MRVIAGSARRVLLAAPAGDGTRPTADRAKEALFSILSPYLAGARFLDLFCGSGAVGIEALSRGAAQAVFVDTSKAALAALKQNLAATRLGERAAILAMPAHEAVEWLHGQDPANYFDIVFLDPPYHGADGVGVFLNMYMHCPVVKDGGHIIYETDAKAMPDLPDWLVPDSQRDYGRTRFLFYKG